MKKSYDFSGWVTKNDLRCSDGVTIRHGAFSGNHNAKVPLVWNHDHNSPSNVIGNVLLSNRDEGVYGYGTFNNTERGQDAKELIQHGDIGYMSIAARNVKRTSNNDVIHGDIYEVSLVYVPANPGAAIDNVIMHSDGTGEHITFTNDMLIHAAEYPDDEDDEDDGEDTSVLEQYLDTLTDDEMEDLVQYAKKVAKVDSDDLDDIFDNLNDKQIDQIVNYMFDNFGDEEDEDTDDSDEEDDEDTDDSDENIQNESDGEGEVSHSDAVDAYLIQDVLSMFEEDDFDSVITHARNMVGHYVPDEKLFDYLNAEQRDDLANYILDTYESKLQHSQGENEMRRNVFEQNNGNAQQSEELIALKQSVAQELVHSELKLTEVFAAHEDEFLQHGITNIEGLFTVENDTGAPGWIRPEEPSLVAQIINKVKKTPAHTVHGRWADITEDEARARGYIKGNEKIDEVFKHLNRKTFPQTIYKKQTFDRDDWIDITDFDLIAWVKPEMEEMLKYEMARAIFIGDGRSVLSTDKIDEEHIRPIATDTGTNGLFVTKVYGITATNFVETVKRNRRNYKGTGRPTLYIDLQVLTDIELVKDETGRYLYGAGNRPATDDEIAQLVGCDGCVCPEFMDNTGLAIMVNLADYELACPSKGAAKMFDDFDMDFNKMKYLIETRVAGALNKPKAAVVYTTGAAPVVDPGE